jgi:hypothetical protein
LLIQFKKEMTLQFIIVYQTYERATRFRIYFPSNKVSNEPDKYSVRTPILYMDVNVTQTTIFRCKYPLIIYTKVFIVVGSE